MAIPLQARLKVPFVDEENQRHFGPLTFKRWLPLEEKDSIVLNEEGMQFSFSIDLDCLNHLGSISAEEIQAWDTIYVGAIHVLVRGIEVSDQLAGTIIKFSTERNWGDAYLAKQYDPAQVEQYSTIAHKTYLTAIEKVNRLLSFVRAVKGQYWLPEYKPDIDNISSEFLRLSALVKIGDSDWMRLAVGGGLHFPSTIPSGKRIIGKEDWASIREHVVGRRKAPLVGQLLAAAEEFRESGHRRAALTEAVSALEVAINEFARMANPKLWTRTLAGRSSADKFFNHVQHLGLTCTIGYLFPVIFSEEQIPASVMRGCLEAIQERNNVVHNGQRDIDESRLHGYLRDTRALCSKLGEFQLSDD